MYAKVFYEYQLGLVGGQIHYFLCVPYSADIPVHMAGFSYVRPPYM